MALTDANPAFGLTEQGKMLEMSELVRFGAIWIDSDRFLKQFNFDAGEPELQTSKFGFLELRELKIRDFEGSKNGPETSFLDS